MWKTNKNNISMRMFAGNCMFFFNEWKTRESRSKRLEKCWCKGVHFYPFCYYYFLLNIFCPPCFVRPSHFDNRFMFVFFPLHSLCHFHIIFFFSNSAKHFIFMFAGCLVVERHHLNIYLVFACIVNRCALFLMQCKCSFPFLDLFFSFSRTGKKMFVNGKISIWISKHI